MRFPVLCPLTLEHLRAEAVKPKSGHDSFFFFFPSLYLDFDSSRERHIPNTTSFTRKRVEFGSATILEQQTPSEGVSTRFTVEHSGFSWRRWVIGSIRSGNWKLRSYVDQRTGHLYQSTPSILQTTKASNRNDVLSLFLVGGLNSSRMIVPMR